MEKLKPIVVGVLMLAALIKGDWIALGIVVFGAIILKAIDEA